MNFWKKNIALLSFLLVTFTFLSTNNGLADSFLTSVDFDVGKISIPKTGSINDKIKFLDQHNDYLLHAQALGQFNTYNFNQKLIDLLRSRLKSSHSNSLKEFDLGYVLVYNSVYADSKLANEFAKEGLYIIKKSIESDRNPAALLAYALCLAQVEAFVASQPWAKITKEKVEVISTIRDAVNLNSKRNIRGFSGTLKNILDYILYFDGYSLMQPHLPKSVVVTSGKVEWKVHDITTKIKYEKLAMQIPSSLIYEGSEIIISPESSNKRIIMINRNSMWRVVEDDKIKFGKVNIIGKAKSGAKLPAGARVGKGQLIYDISGRPIAGEGGITLVIEAIYF